MTEHKKPASNRRHEILSSVLTMLSDDEKITTAAIATKMDFTEGALYKHFRSKESIFEELLVLMEATLLEQAQTKAKTQGDLQKQITYLVGRYLNFYRQNPAFVRFLGGNVLRTISSALFKKHQAIQLNYLALIKECFRNTWLHESKTGTLSPSDASMMIMKFLWGSLWELSEHPQNNIQSKAWLESCQKQWSTLCRLFV